MKEKDSTFSFSSGTATRTAPTMATRTPASGTTHIVIKYDCGFGNTLFIRGKGANLSWDKGTPAKNIGNDEWVWECSTPFQTCEFKALVNDKTYEQGQNHILTYGSSFKYTPSF